MAAPPAKGKAVRTVTLAADADALPVESAGTTWTLKALPLSEYPAFPELPEVAGALDGGAFARAVTRVAVAAGRDDTLWVNCSQSAQYEPQRHAR